MNFLALIFLLGASAALLCLPRRWATVPLLAGASYITMGQQFDLGPFSVTVLRFLILLGFIRAFIRREGPAGGLNGLDKLMIAWSLWACFAAVFHKDAWDAFIFRLGIIYNSVGFYFLVRCFVQSWEDVLLLIKSTALLLVPIAFEMAQEQFTHRNLFSIFGGVGDQPVIRNGRLRAQGPFRHPILAGTVGAVCLPLMIVIWRKYPWSAKLGLAACLIITGASASSGPILSIMAALFVFMIWRWRHLTRYMRIAAVVCYILLDIVMKDPAYYILARIDLTGSSSSYHRPAIIEAAIKYLGEWWLAGTDYTRHWMPYGVSWSEDHADITNHYIAQGVRGGLLQMILFIATIWCAFRYVGDLVRTREENEMPGAFAMWTIGACLFAHAATCISVAYFDQSVVFLYLVLAILGSLYSTRDVEVEASQAEKVPDEEVIQATPIKLA